jgi:hypothetical protein
MQNAVRAFGRCLMRQQQSFLCITGSLLKLRDAQPDRTVGSFSTSRHQIDDFTFCEDNAQQRENLYPARCRRFWAIVRMPKRKAAIFSPLCSTGNTPLPSPPPAHNWIGRWVAALATASGAKFFISRVTAVHQRRQGWLSTSGLAVCAECDFAGFLGQLYKQTSASFFRTLYGKNFPNEVSAPFTFRKLSKSSDNCGSNSKRWAANLYLIH